MGAVAALVVHAYPAQSRAHEPDATEPGALSTEEKKDAPQDGSDPAVGIGIAGATGLYEIGRGHV